MKWKEYFISGLIFLVSCTENGVGGFSHYIMPPSKNSTFIMEYKSYSEADTQSYFLYYDYFDKQRSIQLVKYGISSSGALMQIEEYTYSDCKVVLNKMIYYNYLNNALNSIDTVEILDSILYNCNEDNFRSYEFSYIRKHQSFGPIKTIEVGILEDTTIMIFDGKDTKCALLKQEYSHYPKLGESYKLSYIPKEYGSIYDEYYIRDTLRVTTICMEIYSIEKFQEKYPNVELPK